MPIPAWVDSYVGIPFKAMGRDRSGLGCWGLVYLVYREQFGREVPPYSENRFTVYDSDEVGKLIAGEVATKWVSVDEGFEAIGDAILIRVNGWPAHIGVVVEPREKKFLHVRLGADSCVDRYDSPIWARRFAGFYRWDGELPDEVA